MLEFHRHIRITSKTARVALSRAALVGVTLAAGLAACVGCTHAPQADAAPPPRADAHPLPPIPSKYPHPKLPVLPGDTRPRPASPGP